MTQYYIRRLKGGLRLVQRTGRGTEGEQYTTIEDTRVAGLNHQVAKKLLTPSQAHALALQILEDYRAKASPSLEHESVLETNLDALRAYWREVGIRKHRKSPEAAYNRLLRAMAALKETNIKTASGAKLEDAILTNLSNRTSQRDAIAATRQILAYLGINEILHKPQRIRAKVKCLSLQEFTRALWFIEEPKHKLVFWAAFATGARQGEVFELSNLSPDGKAVEIRDQLTRKKVTDSPKNGRGRWTYVLTEGREAVEAWVKTEDKAALRHVRWAEELGAACTKAGVPVVTFHDLRHSYAVHLLRVEGLAMEKVARFLGNSIIVCQEYYTGYVASLPDIVGLR